MSCYSLKVHTVGGVPFTVDRYDPVLFLKGTLKRNLGYLPPVSKPLLRRFRDFVRRVVRQLFVPLDKLSTFEEWLAEGNYSGPRKDEMRRTQSRYLTKWKQLDQLVHRFLDGEKVTNKEFRKVMSVDSFDKAEFYEDQKYPRTINSRSDAYKCRVGPAVHSMEKVVYKLKWFIKHVPVRDRPAFISRNLKRGAPYKYSVDFTSFEMSFIHELQVSCERWLYSWLLQKFPDERAWVLAQMSDFVSTGCGVKVEGQCCRMSGEMTTSLGNGFTNLMLHMFQMECQGLNWQDYCGIIEGDDSLSTTTYKPDVSIWARLGFVTKLQYEDFLNEASFCGNVYVEGEDRNIGDPVYYCASAGWSFKDFGSSERVRGMLTFAKGASYVSQFAGSPVIQELGHRLIRESGVSSRAFKSWFATTNYFDLWERTKFTNLDLRREEVTPGARALCQRKFGVQCGMQVLLENYLRETSGPIDSPLFRALFPEKWQRNYATVSYDPFVYRLPVPNRPIFARGACNVVTV